jgi:DNA-binding transcriptional ArsR family regulator
MTDHLATIAEPRRRRILQLIWTDELSAGDITKQMDVTFGAVSQHLKILRTAGLVSLSKRGRHHFYRAIPSALGPLAQHLEAEWTGKLQLLKQLAEDAESHND